MCIPLTKATKTFRRAPAGALIAWSTADGTKVGAMIARLPNEQRPRLRYLAQREQLPRLPAF